MMFLHTFLESKKYKQCYTAHSLHSDQTNSGLFLDNFRFKIHFSFPILCGFVHFFQVHGSTIFFFYFFLIFVFRAELQRSSVTWLSIQNSLVVQKMFCFAPNAVSAQGVSFGETFLNTLGKNEE